MSPAGTFSCRDARREHVRQSSLSDCHLSHTTKRSRPVPSLQRPQFLLCHRRKSVLLVCYAICYSTWLPVLSLKKSFEFDHKLAIDLHCLDHLVAFNILDGSVRLVDTARPENDTGNSNRPEFARITAKWDSS